MQADRNSCVLWNGAISNDIEGSITTLNLPLSTLCVVFHIFITGGVGLASPRP